MNAFSGIDFLSFDKFERLTEFNPICGINAFAKANQKIVKSV